MIAATQLWKMPAVQSAAAAFLAVTISAVVRSFRKRLGPDEIEQQRRALVNRQGRIGDGVVSDIHDDTIFFTYSVHGVDYQATQDIAALKEQLPVEPHHIIGPVSLKYLSQNPANSIVLCEKWSGLRRSQGEATGAQDARSLLRP